MHSAWLRCFGFLLLVLSCCEAAPSKEKQAQAVRVYPISEEQYEHLLKLTDGKNLISEGRLTSAGFSSMRNTLGSGWHSLLRIIGFSPTETQHPKIDIDGQPLCVMKRHLDDAESGPRGIEGRAANTEESVINCIVVLKRDPALQSLSESNPDFAPYWYNEYSEEPQQKQQQQEQSADIIAEQVAAPEPEQQVERFTTTTTTTIAPKVTKKRTKTKAKHKKRLSLASVYNKPASRQYSPYAPPPPPPPPVLPPPPPSPPLASYANPYGGAYPFAGYSPDPYSQYNPYAAYSQQLAFGPQSAYGQQTYPYSPPYYGQSPYYSPVPYYEEDEEDEDDIDDDGYSNTVYVEPEEDDYYN